MDPLTLAVLGSGILGAGASIFGASQQAKSSQNAINAELQMFNTAKGEVQPFINAGQGAAGTLSQLLTPGANMTDILNNIPGMQFLQKLTQQGVSNQGTTTGLSGNTLLAGANAGNNIALSAGWQPIVSALQGLVTSGAGAAGSLAGNAVTAGGQIGSANIGIGNALGGAATSVGSNVGNSLTTAALFSKLLNGANGTGVNPAAGMYQPSVPPNFLTENGAVAP